jgi:hypothetical protein
VARVLFNTNTHAFVWYGRKHTHLPSPDTTKVEPASSDAGSTSNVDCTKLCK